jgi:hypothetical protein
MFHNFALTAAMVLGVASSASAQVRLSFAVGAPVPVVVAPRPVVIVAPDHYHVQYRQAWQERIFTCPIEARAFERHQERLGYHAYTSGDGLCWHVHYRLPGWQPYRTVHSHYAAHQLERRLESQGVDARLVHH